jgi:zinc transporter, ZIP family
MWNAFLWGLFATSSLILGGILATRISLGKKALGLTMAFGAGTLISAVSYELIFEAVKLGKGTGFPVFGLFTGALVFYFSDRLMDRYSISQSKVSSEEGSSLLVPMVLAIILDGIPESIVIGLSIFEGGTVSIAMLVAVFISNMPESIAGTTGMRKAGWSKIKIISLWTIIAFICALASVAGFALFSQASDRWLSFIQAFAGGAILIMLANSMIPESFEHSGKLAGLLTILGFFIAVVVVVFENSH